MSTTNRRPITPADLPAASPTAAAAAVDAAPGYETAPPVQADPLAGPLPTARAPNARSAPTTTPPASLVGVTASFTQAGDRYFPAPHALTLGSAVTKGTGTLAYAVAPSGSGTYTSATLPVALAAGDTLRITASSITGYVAVSLRRLA